MELLVAMEQECGVQLSCLRVDGGMTVNKFLMQFQADILDKEVRKRHGAAGMRCEAWGGRHKKREYRGPEQYEA